MGRIEALDEIEQERYDGYLSRLEKLEPTALANELAMIMVFTPFLPIEKIIEQATENTRIIRHNQKVRLERKKAERLQQICRKKRPTQAELIEAKKLCKDLKIDIGRVGE